MKIRAGFVGLGWMIITLAAKSASAGPPVYLELKLKEANHRGKLVAMDKSSAWLMTREGKLNELLIRDIKGMTQLSSRFKPYSAAELRDSLRREFGRDFEVAGSGHYLVCAPKGKAQEYARLFDEIYRSFHGYFSVRGFRIAAPEFPLVAIIFPDHKSFDQYCQQDGFRAFRGLMGYYKRDSNRVALFDSSAPQTAMSELQTVENGESIEASIQAGLADTMIHEATHQVAFNTGLHSRIGHNPKWIVEGLATVFESPGIRASSSNRGKAMNRINKERYVWFQNFVQSRRKPKSLATFVSSDRVFQSAALDGYAEAWALSFYLIETRPAKYAKYLKTIATRDPMKDYSAKDRLDDFQSAFGSDFEMLEADFLRFYARLEQ